MGNNGGQQTLAVGILLSSGENAMIRGPVMSQGTPVKFRRQVFLSSIYRQEMEDLIG